MKVAPFLLLPSTAPAERIYVSDLDTAFAQAIEAAVGAPRVARVRYSIYGTQTYPDVWVQDQIEIGYSAWPAGQPQPSAWNLPRTIYVNGQQQPAPLTRWPTNELLGPNFGHFRKGTAGNLADEFGGNLEVTPPITVGGTHYSLGRAIIGQSMNRSLKEFLNLQQVQAPIIPVDASWLLVGHIDEVINFVPNGNGFAVLIADTAAATNILATINVSDTGTATSAGTSTFTDTSKSWSQNRWLDGFLAITSGTGAGQVRQVAGNSGNQITLKRPWAVTPTTGSGYEVVARSAFRSLFVTGNEDLGVVGPDATSTAITDATKNWTPNAWAGGTLRIAEGTGAKQVATILGNTPTTLYLTSGLATVPDVTSRYTVLLGVKQPLTLGNILLSAVTVREVLRDYPDFITFNADCQGRLNSIRTALEAELGSPTFVQVPALFIRVLDPNNVSKAQAWLPNMVNSFVDSTTLVVPKPFGPRNPDDLFETDLTNRLPGLNLKFVDDWDVYHSGVGEVHCGTNARRTPPSDVKWWEQ